MKTPLNRWCAVLAAAGLIAASSALAAQTADGPYLRKAGDKAWLAQWVEPKGDQLQVRSEKVSVGRQVEVPAVGDLPAFKVRIRAPAKTAPSVLTAPAEAPLFVVADTHGEYEILVDLLRRQRIIDAGLRWSYGRGHLVFLGDVFDRGEHQTEILWLIYKLEAEAAKAGGSVHLVLGNHEAMVLRGDLRYLNPRYTQTATRLGVASYPELFGPDTLLGQWLRSQPAVLKFNRLLLMHGGISPELVSRKLTLNQINQNVREVLMGAADPAVAELPKFVMGSAGPLWYRGYFSLEGAPAAATAGDVDAVLRHFDVDKVLVGHTAVLAVTPLYGGKVIAVQVYPHRDEQTGASIIEAAVLERGRWYRAKADGSREALEEEPAQSRPLAGRCCVRESRRHEPAPSTPRAWSVPFPRMHGMM